MLCAMNPLKRVMDWLKPPPKTAEDIEAALEAAHIRDEMKTDRLSQRSAAGSIYESDRRSSRH